MSRQEEWNLERWSNTASTSNWDYNSQIKNDYMLYELKKVSREIEMRSRDMPTPYPIDTLDVTIDIDEDIEEDVKEEPEKEFLFDPKELDV